MFRCSAKEKAILKQLSHPTSLAFLYVQIMHCASSNRSIFVVFHIFVFCAVCYRLVVTDRRGHFRKSDERPTADRIRVLPPCHLPHIRAVVVSALLRSVFESVLDSMRFLGARFSKETWTPDQAGVCLCVCVLCFCVAGCCVFLFCSIVPLVCACSLLTVSV